jgi:DNA topoisomerase-2
MTVTEFLNNEVVDFASYSTMRAIASLVDGFKNGGRKVAYTVMKRPDKDTKVSILAGIIAIETEYLHGDISGSVVTMAKNFAGTNNIPLLTREGNFGTRFEPEASANRYIFTAKEKIFDKIFDKIDNNILINQEFEGTEIEPRFYVPNLPMILINGSEGIATGFAQKILPRNPDDIKLCIKTKLSGQAPTPIKPWFKDFNGVISQGETSNQWIIDGVFERKSLTKLIITELPIGYNLTSYTKILDDLEDKKKINGYSDLSENDTFKFEVQMKSTDLKKDDEWILKELKLTKKVSENYTVLDENNRVQIYSSAEEILDHYIKVKLEYTQKRKDYLIKKLKDDTLLLASKYIFIKNVTDGNIIVNKKKKTEIISQIEPIDKIIKYEDSYDYLLKMPIYSLTLEKMEELKEQIMNKKQELADISSKEIQEIWFEDMEKC